MSTDAATRLAGATKPCPTPQCEDGYEYSGVEYMGHYERWACPECQSSGRVYYFPEATGVRVACSRCKTVGRIVKHLVIVDTPGPPYVSTADDFETCPKCHGRGWVAAMDGWLWLEAARAVFPIFIDRWSGRWNDYRNMTYKCQEPEDLQKDFFEFLGGLVVADDGTLLEGKE